MDVLQDEQLIRAATFGRGVWESELVLESLPLSVEGIRMGVEGIKVIGNPTSSMLSIDMGDLTLSPNGVLSISDILGKQLINGGQASSQGIQAIDVSHLNSGTYILTYADERSSYSVRFVKQ